MVLLDYIITIVTPLAPIIISYLLLQYLPTRASRKLALKRLNEANETFKEFRKDLQRGVRGWKGVALAAITYVSMYISLFVIQYYHSNENILYIPLILILIGEVELVAIRIVKKRKVGDPLLAYDLKTNSSLVLTVSILVWLTLFIYDYMATPVPLQIDFVMSFIPVAGGFMVVAAFILRLEKTSDLENFIFQSKYNNKIGVACITKSRLTCSGKVVGIGQFLLLKSNRRTQVIRWHDIQEIALLSDR